MLPPILPFSRWSGYYPGAVVADVRWYLDGRSGLAAYERGHLPGAVHIDLDRWLAGPPGPARGRHPLPDPAVFAHGMTEAGIGDDDTVLAYDDEGGVVAARLVWLLRVTGHRAALLDGGLAAYDGVLATGPAEPARGRARFTVTPWPVDRFAGIEELAAPAAVLLDARSGERYRGEHEPVDPQAGHIPGARSLPCRDNLDAAGRLLPVEVLRQRFAAAGVTPGADVVSYCGSGVTACHNLLTLELSGLPPGRLYAGSWSQYSASGRPVATGAKP